MNKAFRSNLRSVSLRSSSVRADPVSRTNRHRLERRTQVVSDAPSRLAERLVAEAREEVRRADAKATQWLTMIGSVVLALMTVLAGQSWRPSMLSESDQWTWWAGCASAAMAVFALVLALIPRTSGDPDLRQVAYFGHIHRLRDPTMVRHYVERAAADTMPGLISQLCWISRLAMTKYRYARIGTIFASLAAALTAMSFM
jgi:hypothetical protein